MPDSTTATSSSIANETVSLVRLGETERNYSSIQQQPPHITIPLDVTPDATFGPQSGLTELFAVTALGMLAGAAIGGVIGHLSATDGNESKNTVIGALLGGIAGSAVGAFKGARYGHDLWRKMDLASHARQLLGPMSEERMAAWQGYQTERYGNGFLHWIKSMHNTLEFEKDEAGTALRLQKIMNHAEGNDRLRATFFRIAQYAITESVGPAHGLIYMELESVGMSPLAWKMRDLAGHAAFLLGEDRPGRSAAWQTYHNEVGGEAFRLWLTEMIETVELHKDPQGVKERLAALMTVAESSDVFREELFGLATEYTRQCEDRTAQGLNEMELALEDFRLTDSDASTEEFKNTGMSKLRSVILKQTSQQLSEHYRFKDDISVHFYLVARLAEPLGLPDRVRDSMWAEIPLQDTEMPEHVARVWEVVLQESNAPGALQTFLLNEWRPWGKHVERQNSEYFQSILTTAYEIHASVESGSSFNDLPMKANGENEDDVDPDQIDPSRYEAYLNLQGTLAEIGNYCEQSRKDLIAQLTIAYLENDSFDAFDFDEWNRQYTEGFAKFRHA